MRYIVERPAVISRRILSTPSQSVSLSQLTTTNNNSNDFTSLFSRRTTMSLEGKIPLNMLGPLEDMAVWAVETASITQV